jgi:hypothetical protein
VTRPAFGQVGCVYTAQGFEYDWSGVILGPDLVWRGDRWVAQPGKSFDTQVKRAPLRAKPPLMTICVTSLLASAALSDGTLSGRPPRTASARRLAGRMGRGALIGLHHKQCN